MFMLLKSIGLIYCLWLLWYPSTAFSLSLFNVHLCSSCKHALIEQACPCHGVHSWKSTVAKSCASSTLSGSTLFFQKCNVYRHVFQIHFLAYTADRARAYLICFALLQSIHTYFGAHLASYSVGTGGCCCWHKAARA